MTAQTVALLAGLTALNRALSRKLTYKETCFLINAKTTKTSKQNLANKLFFMQHISEHIWEQVCEDLTLE